MCSKSRNEDKDNIDQDIDVCAMGVQTIMQSDHVQPKQTQNPAADSYTISARQLSYRRGNFKV